MTHPIVACARGWIGTRFHHQGRIRKTGEHRGGVDCLGLLVGVAQELDLRGRDGKRLAELDERDYSHRPDAGRLRERLAGALLEVAPSLALPRFAGEGMLPGDILLLSIDGSAQHLGIVSDFPVIPASRAGISSRLHCGPRPPLKAGVTGCEGLGLIHAYAPALGVVEHGLDAWWRERVESAFRVVAG